VRHARPQTVNNLAGNVLDAFEDHGVLDRTIDRDLPAAQRALRALTTAAAINLDDIGQILEEQGIAAFHASYRHALLALGTKANTLLDG
jgi:transaldolase